MPSYNRFYLGMYHHLISYALRLCNLETFNKVMNTLCSSNFYKILRNQNNFFGTCDRGGVGTIVEILICMPCYSSTTYVRISMMGRYMLHTELVSCEEFKGDTTLWYICHKCGIAPFLECLNN